jgi:osmotically-inducible protein OsmY
MKAISSLYRALINRIRAFTKLFSAGNSLKTASCALMAAVLALLAFSVPVHAAEMDSLIESSARQSYVFKTYLQGDDIKIQPRNGAVTLTGMVNENFHKSLAQETIAAIPGVKSVDNRLGVKGAPPTANSDAWLRDKVKVAILFHRSVSANAPEVDVKNGIVTLRGEEASQPQKALMIAYARDVEGIKDVTYEIMVSKTPEKTPQIKTRIMNEKIDDASITAQVNMTLLNHRTTNVLNTTVQTKSGIVTVGGKAGNAAVLKLVTKLVADINGVKGVTNRMTIE